MIGVKLIDTAKNEECEFERLIYLLKFHYLFTTFHNFMVYPTSFLHLNARLTSNAPDLLKKPSL